MRRRVISFSTKREDFAVNISAIIMKLTPLRLLLLKSDYLIQLLRTAGSSGQLYGVHETEKRRNFANNGYRKMVPGSCISRDGIECNSDGCAQISDIFET